MEHQRSTSQGRARRTNRQPARQSGKGMRSAMPTSVCTWQHRK